MGLRTIVLKLHKPSKVKQNIINEAIVNYNRAFEFLINKASSNLLELDQKFRGKGGQYNILALSKWVDSDLSCELNRFDVQPFKDSLKLEFAYTMANYLRTKGSNLGAVFPSLKVYGDKGEIDNSNDSLNSDNIEKLHSIYFCRYDTKRSFCLLYDEEKGRYYAKLYLLNASNARTQAVECGKRERLMHIHKDRQVLERSRRKEAYIVVPLSFGKWQEKIIKEASEIPECFKTARLLRKNNEYYLAISLELKESSDTKTSAFMGVCRGLTNELSYTVVNLKGEVLASGMINTLDRNSNVSKIPLNKMYEAANLIADLACIHKAQVIVQNLTQSGDGLSWSEDGQAGRFASATLLAYATQAQYIPEYKRKEYNRLTGLLDYKLEWKGLPKPVKVSSVGVFYTCCNCGLNSKRNRFNKDFFICIGCGTAMDIDMLGSLNLARKLIDYNFSKIKIKVSKADNGIVFTNKILGLDCFSSYGENQSERLKSDIQKIIYSTTDETSNRKANAVKMSLMKKLKSVDNFMDLIEYI